MTEFPLLLLAAFSVACFIYSDVLERSGAGRHWALAWVLLYVAAILTESGLEDHPLLGPLGHTAGTTFVLFLLLGSLRYRDHAPPAWLVWTGLAIAIARAGLSMAGFETAMWVVGLSAEIPWLAVAAYAIWPGRYGGPFEQLLSVAFGAIGVTTFVHSLSRTMGTAPDWLVGVYMACAVVTATLQLASLLERVRKRQGDLIAEHKAQTRELDALVEAVPAGIMMVGRRSEIRRINGRLAEYVGIRERDSVIGVRGREVILPTLGRLDEASQRRFYERFVELDDSEEPNLEDFEARMIDPVERILMISASQVRAEDGESLGRVWAARDVTEQRRLAQRLYHSQRMETLGTLAGGVAHDFNNQLTAILGNAQLAREGVPAESDLQSLLLDIEVSAERCAELTRGLLAFSRQAVPDVRAVNIESALREVESVIRPSLPPDVELTVTVASDLPPVAADPTQLHRALTNLAVNARDAVGESGRVLLEATPGNDEDRVAIIVRDNGAGMEPDLRERIFDPFFTTKPVGAGTGLGLSIVYGIIESHGATMKVESEPGAGSEFHLLWPVAGDDLAEVGVTKAPGEAVTSPGGELVLVAEDEAAVRRLARISLQQAGFRVLEAADGEEALAAFHEHKNDVALLLVDLSMPRRNGIDTIGALREQRPDLPILLMTGHLDRDEAAGAPADVPILMKPFRPDDLSARVRAMLSRG